MVGVNIISNFSSPPLTVWERQCLAESERKDHLLNELMNHKAVYRTAPATPGLLNTREVFTALKAMGTS